MQPFETEVGLPIILVRHPLGECVSIEMMIMNQGRFSQHFEIRCGCLTLGSANTGSLPRDIELKIIV